MTFQSRFTTIRIKNPIFSTLTSQNVNRPLITISIWQRFATQNSTSTWSYGVCGQQCDNINAATLNTDHRASSHRGSRQCCCGYTLITPEHSHHGPPPRSTREGHTLTRTLSQTPGFCQSFIFLTDIDFTRALADRHPPSF